MSTDIIGKEIIIDIAKNFSREKIEPISSEIDKKELFPSKTIYEMGEIGLLGMLIPEKFGGSFNGSDIYYSCIKEISKSCASHAITIISHCLCSNIINLFGSKEQKDYYLPKLASGEMLGACALTEPDAGSDLSAVTTYAEKIGDDYLINGTKRFITNGEKSDIIVILTSTSKEQGLFSKTLFCIEKGIEGFCIGRQEKKMGFRAADTSELFLDNVRINSKQMIGKIGKGAIYINKALETSRLAVASMCLGIAEAAYTRALKYSKERIQFGKRIFEFQAIKLKLAEMATNLECSKLLFEKACKVQKHNRSTMYSSMAKCYCSEMACNIVDSAMQIFGSYGYMKNLPIERYYRDVRLCKIIEGTNEIQKIIISDNL